MKKIYLLVLLLLPSLLSKAQSFTTSGPRTFYSKTAASTDLYFNFDKGKLVSSTDTWHMTFKTSKINFDTLHGVQAQLLSGTSFATQTTAPASGYVNKIDNTLTAGTGVLNYNPTTHIVTPNLGKIVAIKLADGRYVKLEMISYYLHAPVNVSDSSYLNVAQQYYSFRYLVSDVSSTDWSQQVTKISNLKVPASSSSDYQYLTLAIADTTTTTTDQWNFKIRATSVTQNDNWTKAELSSTAFNSITSATAITAAALSAWYAYEGDYTHTITAVPNKTIVFKDSIGRYGKIVIESYYKNAGEVICAGSGYYTIQYYYNPYGAGENLSGRDGSDLTTSATIVQSVSPVLSLGSSTLSVDAADNAENIAITSNDSWAASTTDSWINLGNGSGSGNGTFTISVDANTGAQRQGTVTVTYCNGASKTVAVTQAATVTATLGAITEKINVYPNPSSDKFNVDLGFLSCEEISITNLQGKTVWNISNPAALQEININGWNKGFYFLKIASQGRVSYQKIEVQ